MKDKIFSYLDSQEPEMIKTLTELISYPSYLGAPESGAPFGRAVRDCLDKALEICGGLGFKTKNFDGYVGTAELGENPILGVLAHLDVVPEGTGWTGHPYTARIQDGKLFGRGAIDDKGPAVAAIYALKALKELGVPLKRGVRLILGTNEECGSGDLAYYFTKEAPPKYSFTPDGNYPVINLEKGRLGGRFEVCSEQENIGLVSFNSGKTANAVPEKTNAVLNGVEIAEIEAAIEKSNLSGVSFRLEQLDGCVKIYCDGTSAHASTPSMGKNSLTALLAVLALLNLPDAASKHLQRLAKLFPYGDNRGESLGIYCCDEESGELTCVLSILDYENGKLAGCFDARLPICADYQKLGAGVAKTLSELGFEFKFHGAKPHFVSPNSEFVQSLLGVYEEVTGEKGECIAIGGGTYVHEIEGGVAFGAEFLGEDNHMHSADEFIAIDRLVLNAKMFALAIMRICNQE